jgi:hypothetical protein
MEQTPGMVKLEGENGGPPTEAMDYDLLLDTVSPPSSPTPSTLDALYSPLFFELANAPTIRYACATADDDDSDGGEGEGEAEAEGGQGKVPRHVVVSQDTNAAETTGGIVWESGYVRTKKMAVCGGSGREREHKRRPPRASEASTKKIAVCGGSGHERSGRERGRERSQKKAAACGRSGLARSCRGRARTYIVHRTSYIANALVCMPPACGRSGLARSCRGRARLYLHIAPRTSQTRSLGMTLY